MSSAYTLFVDGRVLCSNGKVEISKDTMVPEYRPMVVDYIPQQNQTDIILQVSNFHHREGGPITSITLGSRAQIQNEKTFKLFLNIFLIGSILGHVPN